MGYQASENGPIIVKLIFTVQQSDKAVFDMWAYMDNKPIVGEIFKENDFQSYPIRFKNKKMFWRILFIERVDKYAGQCENLSRGIGLNPKL